MLITEDNKDELLKEIAAADSEKALAALYGNKIYPMIRAALKDLGLAVVVDNYTSYRLGTTGDDFLCLSPMSENQQSSSRLLKTLHERTSHKLAEVRAAATDMMRKVRPVITVLDSIYRARLMLLVAAMDKATAEYPGRTVHRVDNRWVDFDNNSWDAMLYTEECAAEASKALVNCRDCVDCTNCRDCCYCEHCKDCLSCSGCKHCSLCTRCHYCTSCISCVDCWACSKCRECLECRDCTRVLYGTRYAKRVCNVMSTSCRECGGGGDCQPGTRIKAQHE